jgi:hypothetical protein
VKEALKETLFFRFSVLLCKTIEKCFAFGANTVVLV